MLLRMTMAVVDSLHRAPPVAGDPPIGVYIALGGLALTVAGIIWKGGVTIGELRATRREHHKRITDLEVAAATAAENRITRQELDARFSEIRTGLQTMSDRVGDAIDLMKEVLKK